MPLPQPNALVTVFGGSGFLGRHLVRALANEGWRIRIGVRRPNSAQFLRPMGRVGQIQVLKADIHDDAQVRAALGGAQACVNLVGVLAQSGRQRFSELHVEAPARLAALAQEQGVHRFVHVSAIGASLDAPAYYFRSKASGETALRGAAAEATIVRPALLYGPEDNFFNRFAAIARFSPALPLFGGGNTRFQPAFVGDVAEGIAALVKDPATAGRIYELAGPEVFTFRELMQVMLRATCRKRILVPVPFTFARLVGLALGLLPRPLLTLDQVRMLETDTVTNENARGFGDLGITPLGLEGIVPSYLWRFRAQGQFEAAMS